MEILHTEKDYVIIVKPVGLDSESDVPAHLSQWLNGPVFPLHRLDKNVGGVMVFARTKSAAARLSQCIQEGKMVKEYVAMVHGHVPEEGVFEDLLFKDARKNKVFVVNRMRKGVRGAKLSFRRIRLSGENSLVHIRLYTGRSHQIRVQFASRHFPLIGDHKYGSRDEAASPMLFSCRITFPFNGLECSWSALPAWAEEET